MLLKITIALIMIGIGSSISLKEIKELFKRPKKIIIGLFAQILILPLLAFIIAGVSNLPAEYKIGIVILAACPGGTLSNFISYLIKADTPLSVSLTSTNSFITLITIPVYTELALLLFKNNTVSVSLPITKLLFEIMVLLIVPLIIGMVLNKKWKNVAKYENKLKLTSTILLAIVFAIKFIDSSGNSSFTTNFFYLAFWVILLNILGIFLGWGIGKLKKYSNKTSVTLGIEVGLQNTVLALLVTDSLLKQPMMGEPALVYAMFSFWITFFVAFILKRKKVSSIDETLKTLD